MPDGEQNVAYSTTVAATNGATPYNWSASGLPAGLTHLERRHDLRHADRDRNLQRDPAPHRRARERPRPTKWCPLTLYPQLLITAPAGASLQSWTINRPYPAMTVTATGGTGVYTLERDRACPRA